MRTLLLVPFLLALGVACGGGETPAPAPAPEAAPAAAPAPAPEAAPAPAVEVGPDGPADLAVVEYKLSTDHAVIEEGEKIFQAKGCGGCHAFGKKLVGPDLVGLTDRRTLPWIGRMIQHPEVMIKQDPVAKDLYRQIMSPMANQGVADAELAPLVSYIASKKGE